MGHGIEFVVEQLTCRLLRLDFHPFVPDGRAKPVEDADVDIRDPGESKLCDDIATPSRIQQEVSGQPKKYERGIVTETVFSGEEVKELTCEEGRTFPALSDAVVVRFPEQFLMGEGPGDARNGQSENEEIENWSCRLHFLHTGSISATSFP